MKSQSRAPVKVIALLATFIALALAMTCAIAQGLPTPTAPAPPFAARLTYATGTATSVPSVWVAEITGALPRRVGTGTNPLLSPDGQSVAAELFGATGSSEQGPSLVVYSVAGAPAHTYLNLSTATATPLAWSPDSRYLAVSLQSTSVHDIAARSGLAVIDTRTGVVRIIAHGAISGASFAPDAGDEIAYGRAPSLALSAKVNICISAPDGSGRRLFTHDGRSLNPLWGPRFIAYDRERLRKGYGPAFQIWLTPPGGGRTRRLTNVPVGLLVVGLVPIAFSEDGSRLLAEFGGEDTSEAWTVVVSSGRARRVTVHGASVVGAGISRDGGTLLIDENSVDGPPSQGRVATIPFSGGRPTLLVPHGAEAGWNE